MTVISVLGSGRSGTSAVANLVKELGVYLGPDEHLQMSTAWNPEGCWEHRRLMGINGKIFERYGGTSSMPPVFPPNWHRAPELDDLRLAARGTIKEDFSGRDLWGWKDPTASLTLPFWQDIVGPVYGPMKYVICVRNPVDVIASLQKQWRWPFLGALEAWIERYIALLLSTEGAQRLFFSFDDYFQQPEQEIKRLAEFLEQPLPASGTDEYDRIYGALRQELRTFYSPVDKVLEDQQLNEHEKQFYLGLREACQTAVGVDELDLLQQMEYYRSAIRTRAKGLRQSFVAYARQAEADIKQIEATAKSGPEADQLRQELAAAEEATRQAQNEVQQLRTELSQLSLWAASRAATTAPSHA